MNKVLRYWLCLKLRWNGHKKYYAHTFWLYLLFYFSALPLIPVEMNVCRRWTMMAGCLYPSCPLTTLSTSETIITPSGVSPFSSHLIYKHELLSSDSSAQARVTQHLTN